MMATRRNRNVIVSDTHLKLSLSSQLLIRCKLLIETLKVERINSEFEVEVDSNCSIIVNINDVIV